MSEYHPDIESIVARLKAADVAYFTTGEVLMDDLTYDRDKGALRRMAPAHPYLAQVGSPVAHTPLAKVAHQIPMGSLDKAMNREEFFKWVDKTSKALGRPFNMVATLKADGGSYSAEAVVCIHMPAQDPGVGRSQVVLHDWHLVQTARGDCRRY